MATVATSLKFAITSAWDGVGLQEARADFSAFRDELRAAAKDKIDIGVDLTGTEKAKADIAELTERTHDVKIMASAETAKAKESIDETARDRHTTIHVSTDNGAAKVKTDLEGIAKNVTTKVDADTSGAESNLSKLGSSLMDHKLAVIALTAAFAAMGPIAVATGAMMAGALAGGVIVAGAAAIEMNKKLTASHQEAQQAAQSQADTANRELTDAYRNVADAAEQGAQKIVDAQHNVAMADRAEQDARESLTQAYTDARRELEDLQMQLEQAPVSEESARIALERAQQRMSQLGQKGQPVTGLDVEEAQNNIAEAQVHLDEVHEKNQQLQQDATTAAAKGVEGNSKVVKAQEGLTDATYNQQKAQQDLAKTQKDAAEANEKAAEQLVTAQQNVAKAQTELNKAMQASNGIISQLVGMFADLAAPLQGPLHDALGSFMNQFQALKPVIQDGFGAAAQLVQPFTDALTGLLLGPVPGVTAALHNFVPLVDGIRDGLTSLGTQAGQMFADMSQGAQGMGDAWRSWGTEFGKFLDLWGKFIGQFAGPAAASLDLLFKGINNLTQGFLAGLGPALQQMAGGTSVWYSLFTDLGKILAIVLPYLGAFTKVLSDVLGPVLDQLAGPLGNILASFIQSLTPILIKITPLIVDLAEGFAAILNWLTPMMPLLGPLAAAWFLIDAAMDANPIVLIVGAIAALAAGIAYLATQTKFFQDLWAKMPKGVQQFGATVAKDTKGVVGDVKNFATKKDSKGQTGLQKTAGKVGSAAETSGKFLGKAFGPEIKDMATSFASAFDNLKAQWDKSIKPAIDGVIKSLKPLIQAILPIATAIGKVLGGAFIGLSKIVLDMFNGAIRPVFGFLGDIITAVVRIIHGFIQAITGFLEVAKGSIEITFNFFKTIFGLFKGIFTGDFSTFKSGLSGLVNGFKDMLNGLGSFFAGIWHIVSGLWDAIFAVFKRGWDLINNLIDGFVRGIIRFFQWLYDELVGHSIIPDMVNAIINWFTSLPGKLLALVEHLAKDIAAAFEKLWNAVKAVFDAAWNGIKTWWHNEVAKFKAEFDWIVNIVQDLWGKFWSWLKDTGTRIWNDLKTWWHNEVANFKADFDWIVNTVQDLWGKFWNWLKDTGTRIWNDLKSWWHNEVANFKADFDWIVNTVQDLWDKFWNWLKETGARIWNDLKTWWHNEVANFKADFDWVSNTVKDLWDKFWNWLKDTASRVWDDIKSGVDKFAEGIRSTFDTVVGKIKDIWNGIKKVFAEPINWVINIWNGHVAGHFGLPKLDTIDVDGKADGGHTGRVNGTGGSQNDRHLIAVSDREYVVNANATSRNRMALDAMNYGGATITGYATGGSTNDDGSQVSPAVDRALSWALSFNGQPYNADGWLDCSGISSGIYDQLLGREPKREFTTVSDFTALGFKPGSGGIWDIGVTPLPGNTGHMANTLGGHKIESGGPHDSIAIDGPAIGADDPQFQDHYYLPGGMFSPAYSGPGADGSGGSSGGSHGILSSIGHAIGSVVSGARNLVSDLFEKLTNPLLSAIPDPMIPGMDKGAFGSFPKSAATKTRDDIANVIRGKEKVSTSGGSGGPIGGAIPDDQHKGIIDEALRLTNTPPPGSVDEWERGLNTLVTRESAWNSAAINNSDSNAAAGTPSKGLAQVIDPTFASFKAPGHDNIYEPVDNIAASINYIKSRYGSITDVQQANANMPPQGYADGTNNAKPGWALVGEQGPEIIKFGGGEVVVPFSDLGQNAANAAQQTGLAQKAQDAATNFAKTSADTFFQDLTGQSLEGDGLIPQLFKQVPAYAQQVAAMAQAGTLFHPNLQQNSGVDAQPYQQLSGQIGSDLAQQPQNPQDPGQQGVPANPQQQQVPQQVPGEVHFHVVDIDAALKAWTQHLREQAMGFNPWGN